MVDRPIFFQRLMVAALLREANQPGTGKTQTRRLLKPQPAHGHEPWQDEDTGEWFIGGHGEAGDWTLDGIRFAKGDRLWVRESWLKPYAGDNGYIYRADGPEYLSLATQKHQWGAEMKWRVSIHMPRVASRLTLTVTDVRVERLQAISEGDAIAEGIARHSVECADGVTRALWFGDLHCGVELPVAAYAHLWESINNPRGLCAGDAPKGWAANPWVVAVTFTVHQINIDKLES